MQPPITSFDQDYILEKDYSPSQEDVICGKGENCFLHPGNVLFRQVIQDNLHRHCATSSKQEKSVFLADLVEAVTSRNASTESPDGAVTRTKFVRFDKKEDIWYDIGVQATKQKIGQTMREMVIQRDPEKVAKKALQRSKSSEARKARSKKNKKHHTNRGKQQETLDSITKFDFRTALEVFVPNETPSPSDQLAKQITRSQTTATVEATAIVGRTSTSDKTICLVDAMISSLLPPSLQCASSCTWFDVQSVRELSEADSDFSDIFDDYDISVSAEKSEGSLL